MLSQFFILSTRGDTIIKRDCKIFFFDLLIATTIQLDSMWNNQLVKSSSVKLSFGQAIHLLHL